MREDQQETNDQDLDRDDVSIHEYEDIDNNYQNGVQQEMNDQKNWDRDDVSIHEYEDIDNKYQNGAQCQPDDIAPEIEDDSCQKEDPFYAAAAEVSTYESADSHTKNSDSFYNKEQCKSKESATYVPRATPEV
ncbi:Hypp2466 [Branchiostoma lanceolatum]|uniref:Hypp2466 protein n=1 Tax=Branchiostoma lanceolatum TaxID=7740 RepID=A0A8K0ESJ1_BRALA|nr:Hypp2466 [Branchiostoma lanceolatum]